jgi:L-threonylcarbamoyladenylate synthase
MNRPLTLSINDPKAIPTAKRIIQDGGVIAFPTDTIYGVAADAFSVEGILKIYKVKQRPADKALPILIGEMNQLECLTRFISESVQKAAEAFWPGPLTLVLPKAHHLPGDLSPYPTIGVRMPDLAFTLALLRETGPLATTSANISGGPNPMTAQDVREQIGDRIDLLLDGGPTPGPIASTVVDMTGPNLKVLREGPISPTDLQDVLNEGK